MDSKAEAALEILEVKRQVTAAGALEVDLFFWMHGVRLPGDSARSILEDDSVDLSRVQQPSQWGCALADCMST